MGAQIVRDPERNDANINLSDWLFSKCNILRAWKMCVNCFSYEYLQQPTALWMDTQTARMSVLKTSNQFVSRLRWSTQSDCASIARKSSTVGLIRYTG